MIFYRLENTPDSLLNFDTNQTSLLKTVIIQFAVTIYNILRYAKRYGLESSK